MWDHFRARLVAKEFDLVHRITPLSPTSQSLVAHRLAMLKIPFIVGPLNGGVPWPKSFRRRQWSEREWLSDVRWLYKLMPAYNSTRKYSAAIIAGSKHTLGEMPDWARAKCVYIPENGFDLSDFRAPRERLASIPLRAVFVGRLVPYKGADMLLQAAAPYLRAGALELNIIGDGPQRHSLSELASELGIASKVHFDGWMPHSQIPTVLRTFDFLVLPSIREFGGGVVVEAMAIGLTPVVADYGGPGELVDDSAGIRIQFTNKESLVEGLNLAIGSIVRSPHVLDELGAGARRLALKKLSWDAKAAQILRIYEAVMAGTKNLNFLDYR
jgi:glycosyltransferase involved in cell wall biosynthesis